MGVKLDKKTKETLVQKLEKELPGKKFEFLGKGGMSYVFSTDYNGKKAAVKIFKEETELENLPFYHEKIDFTQIKHPNLMEIYQTLPSGIIISELCGTMDLTTRVKYKTQKSLERNLIAYWELMQAVKYLVQRNLVHGDLKPGNIVFQKYKNTPKIIDHDTMKKTTEITSYTHACCTIVYAAPEVVFGNVTNKSDVYSLANIFYRLHHKLAPFEKQITKKKKEKFKVIIDKYLKTFEMELPFEDMPIGDNKILKEMINKMRIPEPDDRIDIYEAMNMYKDAMQEELDFNRLPLFD